MRDIYLAVEQLGGVDYIEDLQNVNHAQMYELTSGIIMKYGMGEAIIFTNNANLSSQQTLTN
jgi:hypothetical protein